MTWKCGAIDHGITIFPNGKIGPCCQISGDYLKDISEINNPNRFKDLEQEYPPKECERCVVNEFNGIPSYRQGYTFDSKKDIRYLDIRSSNRCNLKCRYCHPTYSNLWGKELNVVPDLMEVNFEEYYHRLLTNDLESLYITGGEPLLIPAHWKILEFLIDAGISNNISLLYNTNLTLIKYKDIDAINLWKKFKSVTLLVSIDATDEIFEYIRSGASWKTVKENLFKLMKFPFINVSISCTVSILNIWTLDKFVKFCYDNNIKFSLSLLHGPDYLALDVVPDSLKDQALTVIGQVRKYCDYVELDIIEKMITNNINQCLIDQTIRHILLLDNIRNEKLFQHLPFLAIAKERTLDNHEYQQ